MDQIEKFNSKDFKLEVQEWTCFKSSSSSYQKPYTKMKRERALLRKGMTGRLSGTKTTSQHSSPSTYVRNCWTSRYLVWSDKEKIVILVELTVGDESNFSDQVERKQARYNKELISGLHGSGWKAQLFTVKFGCRGFWHHTLPALLNYFSVTKRVKKAVFQEAALVALKCSYAIWLAREHRTKTHDSTINWVSWVLGP